MQVAPESTKKKKIRQHFPYTSEVRDARQAKRRRERRGRKSKSESDQEIYLEMKKNTDQMIRWGSTGVVLQNQTKDADSKTVHSTTNALLNKNQKILPTGDSNTTLSNKFAMYSVEKKNRHSAIFFWFPGR